MEPADDSTADTTWRYKVEARVTDTDTPWTYIKIEKGIFEGEEENDKVTIWATAEEAWEKAKELLPDLCDLYMQIVPGSFSGRHLPESIRWMSQEDRVELAAILSDRIITDLENEPEAFGDDMNMVQYAAAWIISPYLIEPEFTESEKETAQRDATMMIEDKTGGSMLCLEPRWLLGRKVVWHHKASDGHTYPTLLSRNTLISDEDQGKKILISVTEDKARLVME